MNEKLSLCVMEVILFIGSGFLGFVTAGYSVVLMVVGLISIFFAGFDEDDIYIFNILVISATVFGLGTLLGTWIAHTQFHIPYENVRGVKLMLIAFGIPGWIVAGTRNLIHVSRRWCR